MTGATDRKLRVLVVDDHDVVQWGFRLLLEKQAWVERCLAASGGEEAVEVCRRLRPEVALVDMLLGAESGAEVCEEIREASPATRVLLISGAGAVSANVARAAGASGFISKDWSAVDVVKAVRMVSLGSEVFATAAPLESPLSPREEEVLALIATGATNKEIAGRLHLSPHTVKEHASAIYRKLGVRNRAEAARQAQRLQILV
ncbi:MAG TPA: response regulator transcription factor [Solirubrobacterales bacterium]|nr:response regulator transcription factor [Solirubrobacterales bacterium]